MSSSTTPTTGSAAPPPRRWKRRPAPSRPWLQRYIFMSSVAAYGDGLNHHEGDALAPDDHPDAYVRNKAMSERALFRMHQRNGFPVVTLRPPFIYGPGNPFYREAFFWDRLRDRPVHHPARRGRRLMQFVHVNDLCTPGYEGDRVAQRVGHAFNAANPRALTQHEVVSELGTRCRAERSRDGFAFRAIASFKAAGSAFGPETLFRLLLRSAGDHSGGHKAQRMLKFKPVEFAAGLKETYKHYLKHRDFPKPDFAFEDELIAKFARELPRNSKVSGG